MPEAPPPQGNAPATEACVLDTHVVLEAFWFCDARTRCVLEALDDGRLAWQASPAMRAELADVLARLPDRSQAPERKHVLTLFDRRVVVRDTRPGPATLPCADPDDQIFVDLALACRARWLFTRDHALLRLARRAAGFGCSIVPPERYGTSATAAGRDGGRRAR
jgi:predicted nucleic acid-binding protein